jgi:hypothetical protein
MPTVIQPSVYISYALEDSGWRERISSHLSDAGFHVAEDRPVHSIPESWPAANAVREESRVFILLVSRYYLDSKEIHKTEFPHIRSLAQSEERRVIYVILDQCPWQNFVLLPVPRVVVVPSGNATLSERSDDQIKDDLHTLAREVRRAIQETRIATVAPQRKEGPSETQQVEPMPGSQPLAMLLAARLTIQSGSRLYHAMATLLSPTLAVIPLEATLDAGVLQGPSQTMTIWPLSAPSVPVKATIQATDTQRNFVALQLAVAVPFPASSDTVRVTDVPAGTEWQSFFFSSDADQRGRIIQGTTRGNVVFGRRRYLRLDSSVSPPGPGIFGAPVIVGDKLVGFVAWADQTLGFLGAVSVEAMAESKRTDAIRSLFSGTLADAPDSLDVSFVEAPESLSSSIPDNLDASSSEPSPKPSSWITQETFNRFSSEARVVLSRAKRFRKDPKSPIRTSHLLHAFREHAANRIEEGRSTALADFVIAHDSDLVHVLVRGPDLRFQKEAPAPLESPPSVSDNVRSALLIAIEKAGADPTIEDSHLLFGVLSTVENTRVQELNRRGMTPERVPLASPTSQSGPFPTTQLGPSTHVARDRWTTEDSLGHFPYAYAIYRFLTDTKTEPPLAISIQAPWGGGKSSLMRMIQSQLDPDALKQVEKSTASDSKKVVSATVGDVLCELERSSRETEPQDNDKRFAVPAIAGGERRRVTIWFNAWKYDSTSQVWAGLADCIVQQIGERLNPVERELFWFRLQLRRIDTGKIRWRVYEQFLSKFAENVMPRLWLYLLGVAGSLIGAIAAHIVNHPWHGLAAAMVILSAELLAALKGFRTAKLEVEGKPAKTSLGDVVQAPDYRANLGFVHEVVEDLKRVFEIIPTKHLPMVVFIDDLDRCSPGKVAEVVEAINLFLAGEFPQCMFIMGIDDEMVAAALDKAHGDVIAKLPGYAKSTSIGWRFMDKFVQLPFIVPPSTSHELQRYTESLLSHDSEPANVDIATRDRAAQVVEESSNQPPAPEKVVERVEQIATQQPLTSNQRQTLKQDVEIIQEMSRNISQFSDQETAIRTLILATAKEYSTNPRDLKRFVNLFRFYYFLRAAREGRKEQVPSIEQMCRWIMLSLRWPEVVRWLRHPSRQKSVTCSSLAALENLGAASKDIMSWQKGAESELGIKPSDASWLSDENLLRFFQKEASSYQARERLSACTGMGLW